jgi:transcriptional regulator with XRE-family HTH domain
VTPDIAYLDRAAQARRTIPRVLRLLRLSDKRSKELAQALGLSHASLSERLNGKTRISSDELAAAALFFDVDPGIFFRDPDSIRRRILGGATVNEDTVGLRASAGQRAHAGRSTARAALRSQAPDAEAA